MIENYCFGSFMIDGKEYRYDLKIVEGSIIPWVYKRHHTVLMEDLKELLEAKPEIIIIGIGAYSAVRVPDDVKRSLEAKSIKAIILPTEEACEEYNKALADNRRVAAIMHSTC
jgi:hypothetical protein